MRRVEIIPSAENISARGPKIGMSALQRALAKRKEIADWCVITEKPSDETVLPWFWCWAHRKSAVEWEEKGLPAIYGPNLFFLNSRVPRIDVLENKLLDAQHCKAIICHSEWYKNLILRVRGNLNKADIILCPYPVEPKPGPPLPVKYDLLIYVKSNFSPELRSILEKAYPRSKIIKYGAFVREELFEAARVSRVCVYLGDDDSGSLAAWEVMLAGCPIVGVPTGGGALVTEGKTGYLVNKLPLEKNFVQNEENEMCLKILLDTLKKAAELDRMAVREYALQQFDTDRIVDSIIKTLDYYRNQP